ncbi:ABC transporter permease subunit [Pontibacter sp. BT310]|uniref:ABC transporter permease n=1 Tax=Pontibacter populi TaxID=890055 RepID=A0ABS6XB93_9BACT|nr:MULTISPECIES: ABC transporter permease subunit [Pontibacter]MBJ6118324.1 ABC transporter permease subunit [Pontibacter sp. BT310]MBR0570751.1 ABC transporter permease subunit [Microvirga sp. STS03]MBW3365177.1 ABC transporter permease [Pontibacter populi]
MGKIIKYVFYDIIRNKIVLAYTLFLLLLSIGLFNLGGSPDKAVLSLLNLVLLTVPLISIVFATTHFYNSYEFIELLVAQPITRKKIFMSEYLGVAGSLSGAFIVGVGAPVLLFGASLTGIYLLLTGVFITFIFVALAFLASVITRDKAKGIGIALLLWFYFALIYDGIVLFILYAFADYPLENATLAMTALNPVDLGRIIVLLNLDVSALMGYTGALYKSILGSLWGISLAFGLLLLWILVPILSSRSIFSKRDL